ANGNINDFIKRSDVDCALPCQRLGRIVFSFPRSSFRPAHRLVSETWRLARDRRARKRIAQFPDFHADLRRDCRNSLLRAYRHSDSDRALDTEYGICHHRVGQSERRNALSLSVYDPVHQLNDEAQRTNDEGNLNAQMTKLSPGIFWSFGFRHSSFLSASARSVFRFATSSARSFPFGVSRTF